MTRDRITTIGSLKAGPVPGQPKPSCPVRVTSWRAALLWGGSAVERFVLAGTSRRRCVFVPVVVVVLVAAACSSGSEGDASRSAGEDASDAPSVSIAEPEFVSESDGSGVASVKLGALPGVVTVVAAGGGVQVSWPPAEPVAGSPVAGYEVQWASGGRDWDTRQRAVVVGLSYTIFGLDDATAYTVRVRPAAVETASVGGASITVGAGAGPIVEIVEDAPALGGSTLRSVSTLPGAVNFEVTGEAVWPATITIPVNMSLVAEDSDVQLVYYNESLTAWVPVPGSVLDRDRGVMTAEVYHLTVHDVVCFSTPVVCGAVTLGVNALRAMKEFVDSAWDANRGWLREGWLEAREFVLQDVPVLAQAMLDKLRETGQTIAPWALAFLKAAIGLNPETLGYMKSMLLAELGVGVSPPECHSQQPGWAETSFVASSDALLWCAETASDDGGSGQDMGLVHTVNRGYSLLMSRNRSSVKFGDPSPDRISVDEAEFPTVSPIWVSADSMVSSPAGHQRSCPRAAQPDSASPAALSARRRTRSSSTRPTRRPPSCKRCCGAQARSPAAEPARLPGPSTASRRSRNAHGERSRKAPTRSPQLSSSRWKPSSRNVPPKRSIDYQNQ